MFLPAASASQYAGVSHVLRDFAARFPHARSKSYRVQTCTASKIYIISDVSVALSKRFMRTQSSVSLERIKVQNFKSFQNLDISLNKFNVIIGANASGKSNFAQVFKFLNDITVYGLDGAISMQGGMEYLLNFAKPDSALSYEITFNVQAPNRKFLMLRTIKHEATITKAVYRFKIQPESGLGVKIIDDEWQIGVDVLDGGKNRPMLEITIKNENGELKTYVNSLQDDKLQDEIFQIKKFTEEFFSGISQKPQLLSLEIPVIADYLLGEIGDFCSEIEVYDFDPKLAKLAVQIRGTNELKPDGANLAIAMKSVMEDENNRRMFSNIIADVLPFVSSVDTKKLLDRSVMLMQKESYFKDKSIPATLVSDGTINVTALICALYFQNSPLTIIEEPERNIHPSLIAKIADMLNDASSQKQIIVTTHSAEMIRHIDIADMLLIRRNEAGNSEIIKPGDQADIKEFLENDMDIRELYVQNMLDG